MRHQGAHSARNTLSSLTELYFTAFDRANNTVLHELSWPSGRIFELSNTETRALIEYKDRSIGKAGFSFYLILK